MRLVLLALPFAVGCMSGGPGGGTSTTGSPTASAAPGEAETGNENDETGSEEPVSNAVDGIQLTIEGKTYTFAAQQQALPLETYLFLRMSESNAEYPWVGLRAYTNTKGSYPCVNGGTVIWYARSKTESYTSTACVINIRKLGAIGDIIEGDFSGTLRRDYRTPESEDLEEPTTTPAETTIAITRATFHVTAQRSE